MTDSSINLRLYINRCYDVFGKYPRPSQTLVNCPCGLCTNQRLEHEIQTLPLTELTQEHLFYYISADKSKDFVQNANEIKYFLPRMIELFVQGERLHHSVELYFERVGHCPNASFSPKEQAVWQQFADAYLDEMLSIYPWERYKTFKFHAGIFDILLMFYKGKINVLPFLQRWRHTETPQAIINYVDESYWDFWRYGKYDNAFAENEPKFQEIMNNWISDENNKSYFIDKILTLDTQVVELFYEWNERYGMIEHLFDLMTYEWQKI